MRPHVVWGSGDLGPTSLLLRSAWADAGFSTQCTPSRSMQVGLTGKADIKNSSYRHDVRIMIGDQAAKRPISQSER